MPCFVCVCVCVCSVRIGMQRIVVSFTIAGIVEFIFLVDFSLIDLYKQRRRGPRVGEERESLGIVGFSK